MPKVRDTRRQKARELLRTATEGPQIFTPPDFTISKDEFERQYRLWSQSWIIPQLKELIPELRERGSTP